MTFIKATKTKSKLRLALIGPSGSGKTYSALAIAKGLGGKIAVMDTERGSASKYAGLFDFDVCELGSFSPVTYVENIKQAGDYDVLIIDSLSHAWMGVGGALEMVDNASKRSQSGNSFAAWRDVTPLHNQLVDAILQCPAHVIVTMRAKTEYVMEKGANGKTAPRKVGLAPIQRDGLEYEFDVVADMDLENNFIVSKSRCPEMSGAVVNKPGNDVASTLKNWLSDGAEAPLPSRCRDCNEIIEAAQLGKNNYTAEELANMSLEKFGKRLCKKCIGVAAKAQTNDTPEESNPVTEPVTDAQKQKLAILRSEHCGKQDEPANVKVWEDLMQGNIGRKCSIKDMTKVEAHKLIESLTPAEYAVA